ncbi:3'-5' exonuclease [Sediminibacter sp. Hel_I_10]|uniref:3'-5' exonuclease n=1 Tax=Sediminibacter sp. Hel_I_10 TaxID=1392490 RepID=UPI00047EE155|nr:3'-5' exonuclease [Sediminibacter sp. Hel_I_10]
MKDWLSIFKTKELPEFWQDYESKFSKHKYPKSIKANRYIVFDTETTGFDYDNDRVLSIGAVEILDHEIHISNSLEIYVEQERFNEDTVEIHGIIRNERLKTLTEDEAIKQFLEYIGNAILIAHHADFDITMLNKILNRKGLPVLKNKVLDTVNIYRATRIKSNFINNSNYTLDDIADNFALDVTDRHTAAGDALLTAVIFLRTTTLLIKRRDLTLKQLFRL